jgi:hypothetical protein
MDSMSEHGEDTSGKSSSLRANGAGTTTRKPGITIGGGMSDSNVKVLKLRSCDGMPSAYHVWCREVEIAAYIYQV